MCIYILKSIFDCLISDSYLTANFIITVKNLKLYKFSIIEFIDENSTEVVPVSWIQIDNKLKQFFCKWPGNPNSAKLAYSQKMPFETWKTYLRVCCPRKFYSKIFIVFFFFRNM